MKHFLGMPDESFFSQLRSMPPEQQRKVIHELERNDMLERLRWLPWTVLDHTADQAVRDEALRAIYRSQKALETTLQPPLAPAP